MSFLGHINTRSIDYLSWGVAILAGMLAFYFLTAPPIMSAIVKHSGTVSVPVIYQPILSLIESDYNGPVLRYFNEVWKCEIVVIGEATTPRHIVILYLGLSAVILGALVFAFWRRLRKRRVS